MNLLSPAPYWPTADGRPASFPSLDRSIRCQAVVVGAGVTGALAAWHLAEAGVDTVVLDRREAAHGSTAGSTSLLQYEIDTPLWELAERFGAAQAAACYLRSRDAVAGLGRLVRRLRLDCGFEPKSSLLLASTAGDVKSLQREFEARRRAGLAVEWWPRSRVRSDSTLPHAAAILSAEAAQVDAYRLAYGLLSAAVRRGARVFDRTSVARARFGPRSVELTAGEGHRIRARHLIVATGYEADALLPGRLTRLHSTFAAISEPVRGFGGWPADRCLIWETRDPYSYLRTTSDGRIIIGGKDEPFRGAEARDRRVSAKAAALVRQFRRWFPRIDFTLSQAWAGTFAKTPDGLPFIGRRPGVPHTWFALGYGGNGVTSSLIAAELIRDQILGRPNRDGEAFGFGRLGAVRARPRRTLALR